MGNSAVARAMRCAIVLLLTAAGACGRSEPRERPAAATSVLGVTRSEADQAAIRAGYLERLRLGLGSPFRLIEFSLADPRLTPALRSEIASVLLHRTAEGDSYEIDPVVLLPARADADALREARAHLELIESAVARSIDPRVGELSVRLAYRLAALESTVEPRAVRAAVAVASLVRDRQLAARDARRVLHAARRDGVDPTGLSAEWRRTGQLLVERAAAQAISGASERQALRSVPRLLHSIRLAGVVGAHAGARSSRDADDPAALDRLQPIADSMDLPPRAAIVVALRQTGTALPESLGQDDRRAWGRFTATALDEERFASRHAALLRSAPALRTTLAAASVSAAVGLRAYGQERVWYPGTSSPTAAELHERYGVRVRAGAGVPDRWLPFYLLSLDESLQDLKSLVPTMSVRGLTIEITREPRSPRSLASHTPTTRVLEWPATTGAGTLAHEIAHDLDWQAARRQSRRATRYASDRARAAGPTSFTSALATLTPAGVDAESGARARPGHSTRPAEVLARTFDWFVVTRLAARGRWNGALSSAQDELLTGHGSLRPPGTSPFIGPAAIEALRSVVAIPDVERAAFLSEHGRPQWPTSTLLLDAAADRFERVGLHASGEAAVNGPQRPLQPLAGTYREFLDALGSSTCQGRSSLLGPGLEDEFRELVLQAATARARTLALEMAKGLGGGEARAWMQRKLYGPLWPSREIDPAVELALTDVSSGVNALDERSAPLLSSGFDLEVARPVCSASALQPWVRGE